MSKSEKRKKNIEKRARKKTTNPRRFFFALIVLLLLVVSGFFAYKHFAPDGEVVANALDGLDYSEGVSYPTEGTPVIKECLEITL